jgi:hypothetical protein
MQTISLRFRRAVLMVLRGLHFLGLAVFFGVILADIVIDRYAEAQSPAFLSDARVLVSLTSFALPMRGLVLALVTGVAMAALRYGARPPRWALVKLALVVAIFVNAQALLFPAIAEATHLAAVSAEQGQVLAEYSAAVGREGLYGAANLLMFLVAGALAIARPALGQRAGRKP